MSVKVEKEVQVEGGAFGMDWIDENLWLGNLVAATNLEELEAKNIIRILTVDAWPIPRKINESPKIQTMSIPVTDLPTEDLISHFESAFDFISDGVKEGPVLVHCYEGVSRSVAVVLAYLMKKYELGVEKALEMVRSKRKFVEPNPGFMAQLKLFEAMEFQIDRGNLQYKMFRLYITTDKMRTTKALPVTHLDVVTTDPALSPIPPNERIYRCNKCRRVLATETNIIPHFPGEKFTWRDGRFSSGEGSLHYCEKIYFVEPMTWMKPVFTDITGKLHCPNRKCEQKLGSFCWAMGCLCPCGAKVTPGFYLVPSKIDREIIIKIDFE